jgi:hypothetical protein
MFPASLAGRNDHFIRFPGTSSLANIHCPFGTWDKSGMNPALKCRAIISCPSETLRMRLSVESRHRIEEEAGAWVRISPHLPALVRICPLGGRASSRFRGYCAALCRFVAKIFFQAKGLKGRKGRTARIEDGGWRMAQTSNVHPPPLQTLWRTRHPTPNIELGGHLPLLYRLLSPFTAFYRLLSLSGNKVFFYAGGRA